MTGKQLPRRRKPKILLALQKVGQSVAGEGSRFVYTFGAAVYGAFGRWNTIDRRTVAKDTSSRIRNWNEKVHYL
jgi:hypothetical protein